MECQMSDEPTADPRSTWDRLAPIYMRELDRRFEAVVDLVIAAAGLSAGECVVDVGTGTGSVALKAAKLVGPAGNVLGIDISAGMLRLAEERARDAGAVNVAFREGSAHAIPEAVAAADVLTSSLCLMFVPDRGAAARECARVLRPGGRFIASAWGPPERCDIVRLQQIVARHAGAPSASEVSPVGLADPSAFLGQLRDAGIEASVTRHDVVFGHDSLHQAFEIASIVSRAAMTPELEQQAKAEIAAAMWQEPDAPRLLRNEIVLIAGRRTGG